VLHPLYVHAVETTWSKGFTLHLPYTVQHRVDESKQLDPFPSAGKVAVAVLDESLEIGYGIGYDIGYFLFINNSK
jgi:hypothetical protein